MTNRISSNFLFIKSGLIISIVLFFGKFIQFIKELFIAKEIGASPDLDAFIMAILVWSFFIDFLFVPLSYALIPIFVEVKKNSLNSANLLFNNIIFSSLIVSVLSVFFVLYFIDDFILFLSKGFDQEGRQLTYKLLYKLLPFYIFSGLSALFGAYLNAFKKNILYTLYPAFPALFTIIYFLFLPKDPPIFNQVYGFNLGSCLGLIALIVSCYYNGFKVVFNFQIDSFLKKTINQWYLLIGATLLMGINILIDKTMAANLGNNNVSHLEYGNKLFTIFSSFATTGVSIIFYPYFAEKVASKQVSVIFHLLKSLFRNSFPLLILGTFGVLYFSKDIVILLFQRGAFDATDTAIVYPIFNNYMVCFPLLVFGMIGIRLLNALQENRFILFLGIISILLNITLNYIFIEIWGIKGIALSSSFVFTINSILGWVFIIRYFNKLTL